MQPIQLLHNVFSKGIDGLHTMRLASLMDNVESLIDGKKLTLTMLGRHMQVGGKMRSNIKKADRLLANPHLYKERYDFYQCMNNLLIAKDSHPWIHIDWSCLSSSNKLYVLRASLSVHGRGIVVYEEVHKKEAENNHKVHQSFLKQLQEKLPSGVKPVIVTDAGFRAIWFKEVRKLGWDFVGRVRNRNSVKLSNKDVWQSSKSLYELASNKPKHLGDGVLTKDNLCDCEFIVYEKKLCGRIRKNRDGSKRRDGKSKRYSATTREPWLLVTSLKPTNRFANKVVGIYRERMQIEENFRDTKSQRYGFGLNESETKSTQRMSILLLIAAIATFICWVVGIFVKRNGTASDYQAHSAKFTCVLSIVYLGCEVLRRPVQMLKHDFLLAIETIISLSSSERKTVSFGKII